MRTEAGIVAIFIILVLAVASYMRRKDANMQISALEKEVRKWRGDYQKLIVLLEKHSKGGKQ